MKRLVARLAALMACALAVSVCGEQPRFGGPAGPGGDTQVPVAAVVLPGGASDTVIDITDSLRFTARVTDDIRIATVRVQLSGLAAVALDTLLLDTTLAGTATEFTRAFVLGLPPRAVGQRLQITVSATDGAQNPASVSVSVVIEDPQPPVVTLREPGSGTAVPTGGTLDVVARATDPSGISVMGARIFATRNPLGQPNTISADSTRYPIRLTTRIDTFQVPIPATLVPGTYSVHAFAADSSVGRNDTTSAAITVSVVDTVRPFGSFVGPLTDSQVVAGDSVLVRFRAQDVSGVTRLDLVGFARRGVDSLGTGTTVARFVQKTVTFNAAPRDTTIVRYLNAVLADSTPERVLLQATITDLGGNTTTVQRSVQVVAGPFVRIAVPATGTRQPVGVPLAITVVGRDPDSVRVLGFVARGSVPGVDTTAVIPAPLQIQDTVILALPVAASAPLGVDTITPFAGDRLGNRFFGAPVIVSFTDTLRPTVTILQPSVVDFPVTVGDSILVQARVQDNRGVSSVLFSGIARRGAVALGTDTTVTRFAPRTVALAQKTDTTLTRHLRAVPGDSASEQVLIIVQVQDSSGNAAAATAQVRIVSGPQVRMVRPTDGAFTSAGKGLIIEVRAIDPQGVRLAGWRATGVVTAQDSTIAAPVAGALRDTLTFVDTLNVPVGTPVGAITLVPFAVDSLNDPSGTVAGVTISVQTTAGDVTPPLVTFNVARRVEVDDTIVVRATDASGITRVGFIVRALGSTAIVRGDSASFTGGLTDVTQAFQLNLDSISTFPRQVTVEAFAVDAVTPTGNRGVSVRFTLVPKTSPADAETLTVVAGKTIALPTGGQIADAIYNRNRNELYLSNLTRNRIEIFQLSDSTFAPAIPVGSRPWGIALWPRDTLGNNSDTIIVANSGATHLSVVDVSASRVERRRHRLPNYLIRKVKTATNPATGGIVLNITEFEFSDRPAFVAATCRQPGLAQCDSVLAVYSTTPSAVQTQFPNRGYLAWENLSSPAASPSGHFFFEHAIGVGSLATDTLEIVSVRDTVFGQPRRRTILGGGIGFMADFTQLLFQDSTFVRNSGDFTHALIGEGGTNQGFARAMTFDVRSGVRDTTKICPPLLGTALLCTGTVDRGISPGIFVFDFIANRASPVRSIAMNRNGKTNVVRADSVYVFDQTLRQTGLLEVGGANPGMDFDPDHDFDASIRGTGGFGGTSSPNDRVIFAARPDANVDVFDTFFYQRVTTIPIRDPIIGPIRVAKNIAGQQLLIGVTAGGVVVVRLPAVSNPLPAPLITAGAGTSR